MRQPQALAMLQRIDSGLDRSRARLQTIAEILADRSALAEVEREHAESEHARQALLTEQRDLELDVDGRRSELTQVEKKLYGGTVRVPKELSALSDEVAQIRGLISTREDRLIELLDEIESANAAVDRATTQLADATATHTESQRSLREEQAQLEEAIVDFERERATLLPEIQPQPLRVYDRLRVSKGGLAVAEVAQRTCQGCRVSLPMSEELKARTSEQLVYCQSCGRILHAGL